MPPPENPSLSSWSPIDIRRGEWKKAVPMALFFFLVIATFWVVKPLKRGILLAHYQERPLDLAGWTVHAAQIEQFGKVANMIVAFGAVVLFTALVRRLERHRLVVAVAGVFALGFVGFSLLVDSPSGPMVWGLYVFGDLFSTVFVTLFWAFMNDLTHGEQAKRIYGLVGLGGVVGGFVGATVVKELVVGAGRAPLLLGCTIPLVCLALIAVYVHRNVEEDDEEPLPETRPSKPSKPGVVFEGARLVFSSRYLMGIGGLILLYEIVSNVVDFQLSVVVQQTIQVSREKDEFFATIGQATGLISIAVQFFATSLIMRRLGLSAALIVLPVALAAGSIGFIVAPTLFFAASMSVSDNSLHYSINQSAKEALYVPTSRDEKYKAKAFLDMFVQRFAKVVAVALNLIVSASIGLSQVSWLSVASLACLAAWIPAGWHLGREFDRRVRARRRRRVTGQHGAARIVSPKVRKAGSAL